MKLKCVMVGGFTLLMLLALAPGVMAAEEMAESAAESGEMDVSLASEVSLQSEYSGYCGAVGDGTSVKWTYDPDTSTLTFSGTGAIKDGTGSPDYSTYFIYTDLSKKVVIGEGITRIGNYAFNGMQFGSIELPSTLTSIGSYAFKGGEHRRSRFRPV